MPANVAYDLSLQHPRCVFQLLKRQYSRYTPEMVERITGIPKDEFLKAAELFTSIRKDGDMKKAGTIIYAVGWTQHTSGTQIIRTRRDAATAARQRRTRRRRRQRAARPLQHSGRDRHGRRLRYPSRLSQDADSGRHRFQDLPQAHHAHSRPSPPHGTRINYWSNTPKFAVSFLKAMYGDAAKKENDFAFHYLPKIDRKYSWAEIWDDMYPATSKACSHSA